MHARSGDKGGDANLGLWVCDCEAWVWLKSTLTIDELRPGSFRKRVSWQSRATNCLTWAR